MTISLKFLKNLEVSAASGLIKVGNNFYVIADDDLFLLKFSADLGGETQFIKLVDGELPTEAKARKKVKPDFESLVELNPGGQILVLPSGSKPNRMMGICVEPSYFNDEKFEQCSLDRGNSVKSQRRKISEPDQSRNRIKKVNCESLYIELSNTFSELNIEGAVSSQSQLVLLQRGNGMLQQNGIIRLDLELVNNSLERGVITFDCIQDIQSIMLGEMSGVSLSFTDAAFESTEKLWFVAAAEATKDTYNDGEYVGAVIGLLNSSDEVIFKEELHCLYKPEGLCLDLVNNKFYVVTDSDDVGKMSALYVGDLPRLS